MLFDFVEELESQLNEHLRLQSVALYLAALNVHGHDCLEPFDGRVILFVCLHRLFLEALEVHTLYIYLVQLLATLFRIPLNLSLFFVQLNGVLGAVSLSED